MKTNEIRTRFAPSPTGFLHIGGLRTALYSYLFANKNNGSFVLRIEDTDRDRFVQGATELIYDTLKECGLDYDEGPDVGGPYGPYVQSERKDIYLKYAKELIEKGGAYYCFCTKERLESIKDEKGFGKYDKHCLSLSKEEIEERLSRHEPYVIRQNVPLTGISSYTDLVFGEVSVNNADMDDSILIKSDGMPTYNFANVVDDHLMKINYVMRGTEYLSSTPKYNLLYDAFGWERPSYIHMPPIMKNAHEKLSKRHGDASYADFIKSGFIKEAIINYIALLGWSPKENVEKMSFSELKNNFSIEGIMKSPAIFDILKMKWLNGEYFKAMTDEEFLVHAEKYIEESDAKDFDHLLLAKLMRTRVEVLTEIPEKINFLPHFDEFDDSVYCHKKMKTDATVAKELLPHIIESLTNLDKFDNASLFENLKALIEKLNVKSSQILWTMRVAITGLPSTAGGATEIAELLGKEETLRRLKTSYEWLN